MHTVEMEVEKQLMQAERDELEAAKFELQADRAEFIAEKLEWRLMTKGGSTANSQSDRELKDAKAKLKAERLQLEAEKQQLIVAQSELKEEKDGLKAERLQLEKEKTQLRVAQSQLKAAQSQLEAAKSQLETAKTQLEKAWEQLEIASEHLEAAKAQTHIDNMRLEAAKASLGAARMRFEAANKQLNAAKSRFKAAKTRLDMASSSIEAEKSQLEIKVSQVESEKAKLEIKVSQLESDKIELGYDLRESKAEAERLLEKMKGVEKRLDQCCKDRKALQVEKLKPEVRPANNNGKGNPKVFLDISINGSRAGRIVIELDVKTTPITAENFRALCTGEKGIGQSGKPLHYKGSTFFDITWGSNRCRGGDVTHEDDSWAGECIYGGDRFVAESFINKHSGPGVVSMVWREKSKMSNGSQFFITTAKSERHDGENVAFGHVVEGMDVVMAMQNAGFGGAKCVIAECGQLS